MPLLHVHSPIGTFEQQDQNELANELILIALECEKLPATPANLSLAWVYLTIIQQAMFTTHLKVVAPK